jgi:GrpB-like predicted nucleotidyltransferase (UPF0157 family)
LIEVVPYDSDWPRRFAAERERLERVLAPWLVAGIEHIGSTAAANIKAYTDGKRTFVARVLAANGVELKPRV